jgi:hypothetical protein
MKTQYDPKGTVDDAKSIHNVIISYEPQRMLSFRVSKTPDAFPLSERHQEYVDSNLLRA